MNQAAPSIIAKDGDNVVGYALTMLPEFGTDVPELLPLFALIDTLSYKDKPLASYNWYVMGQVCVAEGYRGSGYSTGCFSTTKMCIATAINC